MAEQKDKCPACQGTGYYMGVDYIGKADVVTCEACNGTGEKKLDRPDREKIALLLAKNSGFFDSRGFHYLSKSAQQVFGEQADQILALFPDIEEAKKQERGRIVDKLTVMGDKEIKEALRELIASPVVLKQPEKAIAQAQLQHDKDTIKEIKGQALKETQ